MNTKLAALCGTLMMVGCGSDMVESPDLSPLEARDLETVFIDCTDLGDAEVVQRPHVDRDGDYQIAEAGIARPGSSAGRPIDGAEVPTSGEPSRPFGHPANDGVAELSQSGRDARTTPFGHPSNDGTGELARPDQDSGSMPFGHDANDGAGEFASPDQDNRSMPSGPAANDGTGVLVPADQETASWPIDRYPVDDPNEMQSTTSGPSDTDGIGSDSLAPRFPRPLQIPGEDEDTRLPRNPCDCPDLQCRQQWVDANLGCNVCVTFGCGDDYRVGACNRCQ